MTAPHDLSRFVAAQGETYPRVLDELRRGRKTSHWMWFIFPQIAGLGRSVTARYYAIAGLNEARAYLAHSVLGPRLVESAGIVTDWAARRPARQILGELDAVKLQSSATLFEAAGGARIFGAVLDAHYDGVRDASTLDLLDHASR